MININVAVSMITRKIAVLRNSLKNLVLKLFIDYIIDIILNAIAECFRMVIKKTNFLALEVKILLKF